MSGKEFVEKLLAVDKYKMLYDNNLYFYYQILFIRNQKEIHTQALIESLAYVCGLLLEKDLEMINSSDQRLLTEEDII